VAEDKEAFIGVDVAKLRNAVAVADAGRDGEVRFYGEVDASPEGMRRLGSVFKAARRAISGRERTARAIGNGRSSPAPPGSGATAACLPGPRSGFENRA
jgi:hypothetical protein